MNILNEKPAAERGLSNHNNNKITVINTQKQHEYEQELIASMRAAGIVCLDPIIADGKIHRFVPHGKGDKDGWYVFHGLAGAYGDWSQNLKGKWSLRGNSLSKAERSQLASQIQASRRAQAEEIQRKNEEATQQAQTEWGSLRTEGHSVYLDRKQVNAFGIRYGDNYIAIPLRDETGKLWSLQKIWGDGSGGKRFLLGGRKKGCFHIIGNIEDGGTIYIAEGYATGASVHMATGEAVIIVCDAGNLTPAMESIVKTYPNNPIIIAGDEDCWKDTNTGRNKAEAVARKYGCVSVFPKFDNTDTKPTDFNDLHCLEGIDVVKAQLKKEPQTTNPNFTGSRIEEINGTAFKNTLDGIFYRQDKEDGHEWIFLCSYLKLLAKTFDTESNNWGRLLELEDDNGMRKEYVLPMSLLAADGREYRENLLALGLKLAPGSKAKSFLHTYISMSTTDQKATCVSKVGWHDGVYVLPHRNYGSTNMRIVLQTIEKLSSPNRKGSLKGWQDNVGKYAKGNTRLAFVAALAFVPPLLNLIDEENFGIHFYGSSSIGKTTLLHFVNTLWGSGIHSWRTTDNAAESLAKSSNDGILLLDELSQVDGKALDALPYMLGNGSGKARARKDGVSKSITTFRTVFVSTGEVGFESKLAEIGKSTRAGQAVRFIEIPADAESGKGIFDTLHNFEQGGALSQYLRQASEQYQGMPIEQYLTHITNQSQEAINFILKEREQWLNDNSLDKSNGQVERVRKKFALIAAAGELAISINILPFSPNEVSNACLKVFYDWYSNNKGPGSHEVQQAIHNLYRLIQNDGNSRFEPAWSASPHEVRINNRAGFKKLEDGGWDYYLTPETFKKEICRGLNQKVIAKAFIENGLLKPGKDNKNSQSVSVPNQGQMRLYYFPRSVVERIGEEEHG